MIEASSHALDQDRVWGIAWDRVVFLNLSPEHMDYHPTLDQYFEAKALLFTTHLEFSRSHGKDPTGFANKDIPYGKKLLSLNTKLKSYSTAEDIKNLVNTPTGIAADIKINDQWHPMECPLFGNFQIENILAALNVCASIEIKNPWASLKTFPGVPGRMESISNSRGVFVFVDYAHKPEALEKVLLSIQGKRIITVFGCGGDRDRTKRPVMGEIATRLSNQVIVTSDNPRTENPFMILIEVENGIINAGRTNYEIIEDREKAIHHAISLAKPGNIVLIAGKGHEDYQIIGTVKRHFDDREVARKALKN